MALLPTSNENIKKLIERLDVQRRTVDENRMYVQGKNPNILGRRARKDPDNRVPVPLAKMAVEDLSGYAGRAGDIRTSWDNKATDLDEGEANAEDEYVELRRQIDEHNKADLLNSELYAEALSQGIAYELHWISDEMELDNGTMTPEFAIVPTGQMLVIWNDSLKPKPLAAMRHWKDDEGNEFADVYYPQFWERWVKPKGKSDFVMEPNLVPDPEGDGSIEAPRFYPFEEVPVAVYRLNREKQPLFEAEKKLIDAIDNLISSSVNEVDRFNALVALFPGKIDKAFVDKLIEMKVIDELGQYERWPEYLEKSLEKINEFYNQLADRIERLYHKSVKVPDMTDENFAGNQSGVAIAFKLIGMEFKASQIDTYFDVGLHMRDELVKSVINAGTASINTDDYEMEIEHKRNLPVDEKVKVEVAALLSGLVSRETLLKFLPADIIDSVEKELARLDEEREENMAMMPDLMGGDQPDDDSDDEEDVDNG